MGEHRKSDRLRDDLCAGGLRKRVQDTEGDLSSSWRGLVRGYIIQVFSSSHRYQRGKFCR
jgi:hypothetical protein